MEADNSSPADVTSSPLPLQPAPSTSQRGGASASLDLLGGVDLLGGLADLSVSSSATHPAQPSLELRAGPTLSPADFQSKWGKWPIAQKTDLALPPSARSSIQPGALQVELGQYLNMRVVSLKFVL